MSFQFCVPLSHGSHMASVTLPRLATITALISARANWRKPAAESSKHAACHLLENCLLGCLRTTTKLNVYIYTHSEIRHKDIVPLFLHICETLLQIFRQSRRKILLKRNGRADVRLFSTPGRLKGSVDLTFLCYTFRLKYLEWTYLCLKGPYIFVCACKDTG